jgi:uncharacterized membrane protein
LTGAGGDRPPEELPAPPEVIEAIEGLVGDEAKAIRVYAAMARYTSGPLPAPEVLAAYQNAGADFPERIMRSFEEQGRHRRALERRALDAEIASSRLGQWMAFILAAIVLIGGIAATLSGAELTGFALIISAMATLTGVFVYGRRRDRRVDPPTERRDAPTD